MTDISFSSEAMAAASTSPALSFQSADPAALYPPSFRGRVPLKVRMAKDVTADSLAAQLSSRYLGVICEKDQEYYVWVNSYGAVSAIFPDGVRLGLKPYEFEVVKWHTVEDKNKDEMYCGPSAHLTPGTWTVGNHPSEVISTEKVTQTNFPCPPNPRTSQDSEKDLYGGYLICESCGSAADAKVISAAKDLLQVLTGHEDPHLWNIEWLSTLLNFVKEGMVYMKLVQANNYDYDSVNMMLVILEQFVTDGRKAIEKATA